MPRNYLLVITKQNTTKYMCYLLGKITYSTIKQIINKCARVENTIKIGGYKAY